jgi:hypothetical protein
MVYKLVIKLMRCITSKAAFATARHFFRLVHLQRFPISPPRFARWLDPLTNHPICLRRILTPFSDLDGPLATVVHILLYVLPTPATGVGDTVHRVKVWLWSQIVPNRTVQSVIYLLTSESNW